MNRTKLTLIGIGVGDPRHLTLEAVAALGQVDVFFVVDKGPDRAELTELRTRILAIHRPDGAYRTVVIRDAERDRAPAGYRAEVEAWHAKRAALWADAIEANLGEGEHGGFLVWGEPALYDSTLRILETVQQERGVVFSLDVVPGISSIQLLAARHRIPLNRVGQAVHVTTGRALRSGDVPDHGDIVVMLDGVCSFASVDFEADIYWGAYLGSPDEVLVSGRLADVSATIQRVRSEARARHGWIMDTYLLRRKDD